MEVPTAQRQTSEFDHRHSQTDVQMLPSFELLRIKQTDQASYALFQNLGLFLSLGGRQAVTGGGGGGVDAAAAVTGGAAAAVAGGAGGGGVCEGGAGSVSTGFESRFGSWVGGSWADIASSMTVLCLNWKLERISNEESTISAGQWGLKRRTLDSGWGRVRELFGYGYWFKLELELKETN
ncbi:hypothetical protein GH714_038815 [Hevea brasiliensis]|uniref:Uncharacterized protein n=1 Tax=Hevea brasiliensis TaxID=3981 RepID=A0A6A6MQL0_HEVBR|nr:hypothetical protein GH714_038815 [Hevea brasiliensis]